MNKFYICMLGLALVVAVYERPGNSLGNTIPDSKAAQLFGGADNCTTWDPQSCTGSTNGCSLATKWKADTDGSLENRKQGDPVYCGSQNCGTVHKTKECNGA